MTQDEFQNILVRLMKYGLEIKMFIESDVLWFDLNTQMKSHLHLSFNKETNAANYRARYDEKGTIEYWGELIRAVRACDHGRGFANSVWFDILADPNRFD